MINNTIGTKVNKHSNIIVHDNITKQIPRKFLKFSKITVNIGSQLHKNITKPPCNPLNYLSSTLNSILIHILIKMQSYKISLFNCY